MLVLCRQEWGSTPFTRVEETAIRNRAHDHGYNFSLFVPTTKPAFVPKWLPKPRLSYALDRFGPKGLAAVVEALIEEHGGAGRVESISARAARFQRGDAFRTERATFQRSPNGVRSFEEVADALYAALTEKFRELKSSSAALSRVDVSNDRGVFVASGRYPVLVVQRFVNLQTHWMAPKSSRAFVAACLTTYQDLWDWGI